MDADSKSALTGSLIDVGVLKFSPQLKETRDIKAKPESEDVSHKFITSLTEAERSEVLDSIYPTPVIYKIPNWFIL